MKIEHTSRCTLDDINLGKYQSPVQNHQPKGRLNQTNTNEKAITKSINQSNTSKSKIEKKHSLIVLGESKVQSE